MTLGISGAIQRPTAGLASGDVSPAAPSASTDGSLRVEPCLCGTLIAGPTSGSGTFELGAHQQTDAHITWRARFSL